MLSHALELLKSGDLVAIPTETVYGLAARIDSAEGLKKIFHIKERPFFDPLIVHVSSLPMAKTLVKSWPEIATVLADLYWPGPLTMVLPKAESVSPLITSGLETVGIRMPRHPLTLNLITQLGIPLAAPSANKFGKTSPTCAEHVLKEFSHQIYILDGGPCEVGIESTIVQIQDHQLMILRKGSILKSDIESQLLQRGIRFTFLEPHTDQVTAPGQIKHHYMPAIPLVLAPEEMTRVEILQDTQKNLPQISGQPNTVPPAIELQLPKNPTEASRLLYSELRMCAEANAKIIYFKISPHHKEEAWAPIMDRLTRAATLIL